MGTCAFAYVFLQCVQDEGLKLAQTLIDARASPLLHNWFRRLEKEREKLR